MFTLRESDLVYLNECVRVCVCFVSGWGWGLRNTVMKQSLPPWTCPSKASSSSASSCLHCTKRPVSFHRRRLTYSLSCFTFRVCKTLDNSTQQRNTHSWETENKCISTINATRVMRKERQIEGQMCLISLVCVFYTGIPVSQLDMYHDILYIWCK